MRPIHFTFAFAPLIAISRAPAQPAPDYDFQWATIGAVGNRGYDGPDPQGLVAGRGSVAYTYRMSKLEITTSQWLEYTNTFTARADGVPLLTLGQPVFWGAGVDPTYAGPGTRYRLRSVANAGMLPVAGLSWRQAAQFCNWLENDKSSALTAIQNGAYDTSTFGYSSPGVFTDQATHSPGARFWIPTLDEWLKGVHFDPNATGPGGQSGRWWQQPNGTDVMLTYGPPGSGQANSGFSLPGGAHWDIPLGSYPSVTTPWGLLDAAGGTTEWNEQIQVQSITGRMWRSFDGSYAGSDSGIGADLAHAVGVDLPESASPWYGFRIASTVPSPASLPVVFGCACAFLLKRRREFSNASFVLSHRSVRVRAVHGGGAGLCSARRSILMSTAHRVRRAASMARMCRLTRARSARRRGRSTGSMSTSRRKTQGRSA